MWFVLLPAEPSYWPGFKKPSHFLKVGAQIHFYLLSLKFLRGQHQKDSVSGHLSRKAALECSMSCFYGHKSSFLGESVFANFAVGSCWLSFALYT